MTLPCLAFGAETNSQGYEIVLPVEFSEIRKEIYNIYVAKKDGSYAVYDAEGNKKSADYDSISEYNDWFAVATKGGQQYRINHYGMEYDFLGDNYIFDTADVVIMNPPYSILEPFLIRALEVAKEKLIVLCRMQVLEGEGRYEKIFVDNPPTMIYQYVDRIQCWKNGEKPEGSSA